MLMLMFREALKAGTGEGKTDIALRLSLSRTPVTTKSFFLQ